jgi:membrane protease YdiL (CAAX protease family)
LDTRRKGILAFVILAFGMAWLIWELPIRLGLDPGNPLLFQFVALPGAFAPAIAALIVRQWITREGFDDAGLRLNLRRGWKYYLFGWLLPVLVLASIILLAMILGVGEPDFSLESGFVAIVPPELAEIEQDVPLPGLFALAPLLLIQAIVLSPLLWGEEFGWRGYLQLRVAPRNPLRAAIATGLIWGLWHLPLNLRGYNFPGQPLLGMIVFTISAILLSIVFGWLRTMSGSVWAPSLAHSTTNVFGASLAILLFAGSNAIYTAYLGVLSWVPLGLICLWLILTGRLKPPPERIT